MMMIERLLVDTREYPRCRDRETQRARFLISRFQGGITGEGDLRKLLDAHLRENEKSEIDTSSWPASAGTVGRAVGALLRTRFSVRKPSQIIAKVLAPKLSKTEAQRRHDSDTDGRQRRENEVKSRNQQH
jgi:hypothetical protein